MALSGSNEELGVSFCPLRVRSAFECRVSGVGTGAAKAEGNMLFVGGTGVVTEKVEAEV